MQDRCSNTGEDHVIIEIMKSKFKLLALATMLGASLMLASCGDNKPAAQQEQAPAAQQAAGDQAAPIGVDLSTLPMDPSQFKLAEKQDFFMNLGGSISSLDPGMIADEISLNGQIPLFDTLTRQMKDGTFQLLAAESYSVSEDGKTWTFKLRPNATWSDGQPVKAADFEYAFKRMVDPKTASPYSGYIVQAEFANAKEVYEGKADPSTLGVKAVDDLTLEIHLNTPLPWLFQVLSLNVMAPVRQDVVEKYGDTWTQPGKIVTNGAFLLKDYNPNEKIEYVKNPNYWNADNVHLNNITYYFIMDGNAAYLKYEAGEVTVAKVPGSYLEASREKYPEQLLSAPELRTTYILINTKEFTDPNVRQAVKLLVDVDTIAKRVLKTGVPTTLMTPPFIVEGEKGQQEAYYGKPLEENRAKAVELLAAAGYSKDNPLNVHFVRAKNPDNDKMMVALTDMLEKGTDGAIKIQDDPKETKTYYAIRNSGEFGMIIGGWGADYDQASTFYGVLKCDEPINTTFWCNRDYDALLDKALTEKSADARADIYAQANTFIQNETPIINLFYRELHLLKSPTLGGLNPMLPHFYPADYFIIDPNGNK